jgi:hypothetical protein
MAAQEWHRALALLSRRARRALVGSAWAEAAWMGEHDEVSRRALAALMERHGLLSESHVSEHSTDELVRMLADLHAWRHESRSRASQPGLADNFARTKYTQIVCSGERAHAEASLGDRSSITRLRRHEGNWYILASGE